MAKHTQAHLSRTFPKFPGLTEMKKRKMEYYMGAKLLELGVAPESSIYRWSRKDKGDRVVWTCSAYWDESKAKVLQQEQDLSQTPKA